MDAGTIRNQILKALELLGKPGISRCTVDVYKQDKTRSVSFVKDADKEITQQVFDAARPRYALPVLRCSEAYTIRVVPRFSGFLTVFNLGTSGAVGKMFPLHASIDNKVSAGVEFLLTNNIHTTGWEETGPATSQTGMQEGLLFVIISEPRSLQASDLHVDLESSMRWSSTRGSIGKDSDGISDIYARDDVYMDVIEFTVA